MTGAAANADGPGDHPIRALAEALRIPGAQRVALVAEGASAPTWSSTPGGPDEPIEGTATVAVVMVQAARELLRLTAGGDVDDLLLTSGDYFHVLRLVERPGRGAEVAHLTLLRSAANLAMARHDFRRATAIYRDGPFAIGAPPMAAPVGATVPADGAGSVTVIDAEPVAVAADPVTASPGAAAEAAAPAGESPAAEPADLTPPADIADGGPGFAAAEGEAAGGVVDDGTRPGVVDDGTLLDGIGGVSSSDSVDSGTAPGDAASLSVVDSGIAPDGGGDVTSPGVVDSGISSAGGEMTPSSSVDSGGLPGAGEMTLSGAVDSGIVAGTGEATSPAVVDIGTVPGVAGAESPDVVAALEPVTPAAEPEPHVLNLPPFFEPAPEFPPVPETASTTSFSGPEASEAPGSDPGSVPAVRPGAVTAPPGEHDESGAPAIGTAAVTTGPEATAGLEPPHEPPARLDADFEVPPSADVPLFPSFEPPASSFEPPIPGYGRQTPDSDLPSGRDEPPATPSPSGSSAPIPGFEPLPADYESSTPAHQPPPVAPEPVPFPDLDPPPAGFTSLDAGFTLPSADLGLPPEPGFPAGTYPAYEPTITGYEPPAIPGPVTTPQPRNPFGPSRRPGAALEAQAAEDAAARAGENPLTDAADAAARAELEAGYREPDAAWPGYVAQDADYPVSEPPAYDGTFQDPAWPGEMLPTSTPTGPSPDDTLDLVEPLENGLPRRSARVAAPDPDPGPELPVQAVEGEVPSLLSLLNQPFTNDSPTLDRIMSALRDL